MPHIKLLQTPACIDRLGEEIFMKLPLYESMHQVEAVYINEDLLTAIFNLPQSLSWQQQQQFIQDNFTLTLDKNQSTGKQCGWAYVDRQADPLNIALAGNAGAGRAYYTGHSFNIKGEKTPLATSPDPKHADGILDLNSAVWNTLIANCLHQELEIGLSPVLAILKITDQSQDPVSTKAQIIRIDEDGSLDRVSHIFYQQQALSEQQLLATAKQFGVLEAEKFIHRILHGSWSAGNISLQGHLIDHDTVCAVKGRQLQFSSTGYYPDNYFGFEYEGQLKIINSLLGNPHVNPDGVHFSTAERILIQSLHDGIVSKFAYLMGFANYEMITTLYKSQIEKIADLFIELSRYTRYHSEKSFYSNFPAVLVNHIFDFSAFFRTYPLLKRFQQFSLDYGLEILAQSEILSAESTIEECYPMYEDPLEERVLNKLGSYFITPDSPTDELKGKALLFLTLYDELYTQILSEQSLDAHAIATRAYILNEDRLYLFPVFSLSKQTSRDPEYYTAERSNDFVNLLIKASKRQPQANQDGKYICDMHLYQEGYGYHLFDSQGFFQICFTFYKDKLNFDPTLLHTFSIASPQQHLTTTVVENEKEVTIVSEQLSWLELIKAYSRDDIFRTNKHSIYYDDKRIPLTQLYSVITDQEYFF